MIKPRHNLINYELLRSVCNKYHVNRQLIWSHEISPKANRDMMYQQRVHKNPDYCVPQHMQSYSPWCPSPERLGPSRSPLVGFYQWRSEPESMARRWSQDIIPRTDAEAFLMSMENFNMWAWSFSSQEQSEHYLFISSHRVVCCLNHLADLDILEA